MAMGVSRHASAVVSFATKLASLLLTRFESFNSTVQIHCTHYLFGRELINPRQRGNDVSTNQPLLLGTSSWKAWLNMAI